MENKIKEKLFLIYLVEKRKSRYEKENNCHNFIRSFTMDHQI